MKIQVSPQLCWTCQRACGGCSWADRLEPVPGWTAIPVRMQHVEGVMQVPRYVDTYSITDCPEYEEDARAVALEPEQKTVVYREVMA